MTEMFFARPQCTLDSTLYRLASISSDYMYTAISGVDSGQRNLRGKPHGGVSILYKMSLARYVTPVQSQNRRVCAVKIVNDNNLTCLLISAYFPCDNYSMNVQQSTVDTIDYIESLINTIDCIGVLRGGAKGALAPPPLKLVKV